MRRAARRHRRCRGVAAVEFALVLPLLLILIAGLVDAARAVQANMIMLNLSREGANLAARGSLQLKDSSQTILGALAATAPPLDMEARGMLYITKIMGYKDPKDGIVRNVVLEQYRWDANAAYTPPSRVWSCAGGWTGGSCDGIPAPSLAPPVGLMAGALNNGDLIYAVESFYQFNMFFSGFSVGSLATPVIGPDLYSMTVF